MASLPEIPHPDYDEKSKERPQRHHGRKTPTGFRTPEGAAVRLVSTLATPRQGVETKTASVEGLRTTPMAKTNTSKISMEVLLLYTNNAIMSSGLF